MGSTPPMPDDPRFERVTQIAMRLLNVPIAKVLPFDERRKTEWFGPPQSARATAAPHPTSLCGHTLLAKDVVIVPDALRDARFTADPEVSQPREPVRFYAGKSLRRSDGGEIGVFCIEDCHPRQLSHAEIDTLRFLAGWAERELNRTRALEGGRRASDAGQGR